MDRAKVLSNSIKQKRKEKAGKWEVPLPKVRMLITEIHSQWPLLLGSQHGAYWLGYTGKASCRG